MDTRINRIPIMEDRVTTFCRNEYRAFLFAQKELVAANFNWLDLTIKGKLLMGSAVLDLYGHRYQIDISYSPFFEYRFDRIFIKGINYHEKIHVYGDKSLCLYHPIHDMPLFKTVALIEMIPWITEWCVHYQEWKKYGIWLGKEIAH